MNDYGKKFLRFVVTICFGLLYIVGARVSLDITAYYGFIEPIVWDGADQYLLCLIAYLCVTRE
jgi:hypothetical protein